MESTVYEGYLLWNPEDLKNRVAFILQAIRESVEQRPGESANRANIRHMEDFFSFLETRFPGHRFRAETQFISRRRVRTTDRNFVVTVPGRSSERLVLVAHYDTWAGFSRRAPGADDNASGEEVLKHYLLRDLCSDTAPVLTHVYLFAGSEECGTRGLVSQLGLTVGLSLAGLGVSSFNPFYVLLSLPFLPLANYRFGVTGTRTYVDSLSEQERASIRAAIAVDSVGEGRLYIPENELGANFLRALFPYEGSEKLNNLLEEGAHLHQIKYNRFLAGGTTDSVAFLEERRFLPGHGGEERIPAAALITMSPGKSSPFVLGGKLHTRRDTPERVFEKPLAEVLTVLDYAFAVLEGSDRPSRPRQITEHHYARLYQDGDEWLVALKDAVEPNRRNINSIFRVEGDLAGSEAVLTVKDVAWWGVKTTLDKEMTDFRPGARRIPVTALELVDGEESVRFEAPLGWTRTLDARVSGLVGGIERVLGRYSFLSMMGAAVIVSSATTRSVEWAVVAYPGLGAIVSEHYVWSVVGVLVLQLGVLFRLFTRELPTWMDNAYRHENRADNLRSLRRTERHGGS